MMPHVRYGPYRPWSALSRVDGCVTPCVTVYSVRGALEMFCRSQSYVRFRYPWLRYRCQRFWGQLDVYSEASKILYIDHVHNGVMGRQVGYDT